MDSSMNSERSASFGKIHSQNLQMVRVRAPLWWLIMHGAHLSFEMFHCASQLILTNKEEEEEEPKW